MDAGQANDRRVLTPMTYHRELVEYLKRAEPHVWEWASSDKVRAQQSDDVRDTMLRQTYRLEPASHPDVFAACSAAMVTLDIDAPITCYQAADGVMNAALYYIPGEVHLVFSGPTLERLDAVELLALVGHELAHYKLWSADEGAYFNASRILDLALSFPDSKPAHYETARLLSLNTELYADRGSALAVGDLAPAVSMLVKVMTGLSTVDPAAYLRQATELEGSATKSAGHSHPESFLRARALQLWWEKSDGLDDWIDQRLRGPLSIEALDLLRQDELTRLTRGFFARFAGDDPDEAVLTQIRRYFPEFKPGEQPLDLDRILAGQMDDSTRDYFVALMFDCAVADADLSDSMMIRAAQTAEAIGAGDHLKAALKRDLKWTKRAADSLFTRAAKAA